MTTNKRSSPTYHSNESAAYVLPNDAAEQGRLNLQHLAIVSMMKNEPFTAPLPQTLHSALDIGCGTGITTLQLACDFPNAKIHGVDITPVPTISTPLPPNMSFITGEIHGLANRGEVKKESYGYVFSRMLFLGVSGWPAYTSLLYNLLEPGGWAEIQEVNFGSLLTASGTIISHSWRWLNAMRDSLASKGLDINAAEKIEGMMKEAGFVDVRVKVYNWSWSRETWDGYEESNGIGRYSVNVLREDIGRMKEKLWDAGTEEEMYAEMREGMGSLGKGSHMRYYAVCGRKP